VTQKNEAEVLAGITDLLPVFRQRAQEAEDARVIPAESVKALEETGFFKLLQPRAYGGLETDPVTFFTAVRLIAGAWLALERDMAELMAHARAGEKIPLPLRLRTRRDQVTGTGQAIRAVDLLFENSGGRALKRGTPIQRFWRDAHAGRVHAINDPERALSPFGRGELGHDVPPDAMF
jgi:alkylation response protein AidB-like acyl-CoA dehydrogenase